jgi:hypothetical protein
LCSIKGKGIVPRPAFTHGSGGYDRIVSVGAVAKALSEHAVI